jgi:hypothetical protein
MRTGNLKLVYVLTSIPLCGMELSGEIKHSQMYLIDNYLISPYQEYFTVITVFLDNLEKFQKEECSLLGCDYVVYSSVSNA